MKGIPTPSVRSNPDRSPRTLFLFIYTYNIGPIIQKRVNQILEIICDERPLSLECDWLDVIDTLSWFIRDCGSKVIIQKASGYQRFIIGIAMRVAINQIGLSRMRFNQLFIDEYNLRNWSIPVIFWYFAFFLVFISLLIHNEFLDQYKCRKYQLSNLQSQKLLRKLELILLQVDNLFHILLQQQVCLNQAMKKQFLLE